MFAKMIKMIARTRPERGAAIIPAHHRVITLERANNGNALKAIGSIGLSLSYYRRTCVRAEAYDDASAVAIQPPSQEPCLVAEAFPINGILLHFIAHDALGRTEQFGCLGPVASRGF